MQIYCQTLFVANIMYMLGYLHKGSFSHPCGNPMACKSTLGCSVKSLSRELFKSMQGVMVCSRYNKVHSWWYNFIGFWLEVIQLWGSRFGNWGFKAKRLFQIRAWWAQQLRSTVMHLIQLSKYVYWGSPNSLATCFFNRLSLNKQNNLESVPKDTASKVFHTGGRDGNVYLSKCSFMKSSFERDISFLILSRQPS